MRWATRVATALLAAAIACACACSEGSRFLLVIDGEGMTAGEIALVVVESRDAAGETLDRAEFEPPPGARFPLVGERKGGGTSFVVELRGKREVLARGLFEADPTAGDQVELRVSLGRGVFNEGCADFDGDGHGFGPECVAVDCDDGDVGVHSGLTETCGDGVDNDCDGVLENGCECAPGATIQCYTGPALSLEFGGCAKGQAVCSDARSYGQCLGERLPIPEVGGELGVDDDCDGIFDEVEACAEGQRIACYEGPALTRGVGLCHPGFRECTDGVFGPCRSQVLPVTELCGSSLDEDCDGETDEPGGCSEGALRFTLTADELHGFRADGSAAAPQPCGETEYAWDPSGGSVTFLGSGLSLSGQSFGRVDIELGLHPALERAELTYATAGGGAGDHVTSIPIDFPGDEECGGSWWIDLPAPWQGEEQIERLEITLHCREAGCAGQLIALKSVEILP